MKSSSGEYFQALDHVRALAAFTVFAWHFFHFNDGQFAQPLIFPLSLFTEGHTGVAMFMTLSGYLFAKLLDGRPIVYTAFLWNRFLRLAPLLTCVILLIAARRWYVGSLDGDFVKSILGGPIYPTLPNGGWSVTVEAHFYVILPLLLYLGSRSKYFLLCALLAPIAARWSIYHAYGDVQFLAYSTLVGRIDQFVLGMFAFRMRPMFKGRGYVVLLTSLGFLSFWYAFDRNGGFYGSIESHSPVWIYLTTLEGLAYASFIAWYDASFGYRDSRWAKFAALIGTYSYSIYLLHFFVVFRMPAFIDRHLLDLSNRYVLLAMSLAGFLAMVPLAYLSYRFIEAPFLKYRVRYLRSGEDRALGGIARAAKVA